MKWYHIHIFRRTGVEQAGHFGIYVEKQCHCGQVRWKYIW